ncbi:hypothetical protein F5148DRAFT_594968 [Russula earlei]|uniref:Uncharacterized protein n=1 Tax=Russula earlei TaxID=71964 RepID=A0ACC0UGH0_9AGAM|nr:hypothetical protein F5148DRAFT_594968 [Russula earlei]
MGDKQHVIVSFQSSVRNAASALKKAADPWNKEDRETADRIISAAILVIDTPSLDQGILDMLSRLLRRPFAELYLTHPGTAVRLSAAIFTTIHDRIAQSWRARDSRSRSNWEQVAVVLLAGVQVAFDILSKSSNTHGTLQDHVESHSTDRVKVIVAQAYYAVICNAFFPVSPSIPLSAYSVSLRTSVYSLLSMTADDCIENKNKLRDSKLLGGAKLGRAIISTKDYLALEQLLILLAYLLPSVGGSATGRAERLEFLRDCFVDNTQRGNDLVELLKYVASPDWEITSDKIVDILARDLSVAQPFVTKSFSLGSSSPGLIPAERFYLDRTSILFNCEDEDGKIEGMHVPYDSIHHVDLSGSGTVVAHLLSAPQCHEPVQVAFDDGVIRMSIMISPTDIERFVRTLRIRGMMSRIKLNGMSLKQAIERTSVSISPTRLEFESSAHGIASYESKVKMIEDGVLQASDPGDDFPPNLELHVNKLQNQPTLLVKERRSTDFPSAPAPVTTQEAKVDYNGGGNDFSSAPCHQLQSVYESSQKRPTTAPLASGPPTSPRRTDPPPLHSPRASCPPHSRYNGDHVSSAYSSPSGHSGHGRPPNKDLREEIFGASDEELSSLSHTDSIFSTVQSSAEFVQSRRITRSSEKGPKYCSRTLRRSRFKRHCHTHVSLGPTTPALDPNQSQNPTPEQKLVPMVKGLRVMDSQDTALDKTRGAATTAKRKIVPELEDEIEDGYCVPSGLKGSSPTPTTNLMNISQSKRHSKVTTVQDRGAVPGRDFVSTSSTTEAAVEQKPPSSAVVGQSDSYIKLERVPINRSRKRIPVQSVVKQQGTFRTAELMSKRTITEGDVLVTPSDQGPPRKRVRVEPGNISSQRNKPHRAKQGISVRKPRKAAPSRVRKTYRNRQKVERSSGVWDVDYDEIPPSTAASKSTAAKECTLPLATTSDSMPVSREVQVKGTNGRTVFPSSTALKPTDVTPNDKKIEKLNHTDVCSIQIPTTHVLDDDDPIRSFSSSPSESLSLTIDASGPNVSVACEARVHSDRLSESDAPTKPFDIASITAPMRMCSTPKAIPETKSDIAASLTACDTTLPTLIDEEVNASAECRPNLVPVPTKDKVQGSSNTLVDLDYLDGPTIIADQPFESNKTENACETTRPVIETIDLTGDTPSPIRSPIFKRAEEEIATLHDVPASSCASSTGRTGEDVTDSSTLDPMYTTHQDFDVSLDSSLRLPFTGTFSSRRPPTPPPLRMKHKNVTFAAPLEEVVEEQLGTSEAPTEIVAATNAPESDELKRLELVHELARGNGLVDIPHCPDERPTVGARPAPNHASLLDVTDQRLSLLSSPLELRPSSSYPRESSPSTAARSRKKHRACDISPSPSLKAASTGRENYLIPIMTALDQIHGVMKSNIQIRFERIDRRAVELRRRILAQTQTDLTSLLDEYEVRHVL